MKKLLFLIFHLFLVNLIVYPQKTIELRKENGIYTISCTVNGIYTNMIFDTGASLVSISNSFANKLKENGTLSDKDFIRMVPVQIANGSTEDNCMVYLKNINVGGIKLRNVQALISSSQNAPLLFGQSAIKMLGSYTINGNKLIINSSTENETKQNEVSDLSALASEAFDNKDYKKCIDYLFQLEQERELSYLDYFILISSLCKTNSMGHALYYAEKLELDVQYGKDLSNIKAITFSLLASKYESDEDYYKALRWNKCAKLYFQRASNKDCELLSACDIEYDNYYINGDFSGAIEHIYKLINDWYKSQGYDDWVILDNFYIGAVYSHLSGILINYCQEDPDLYFLKMARRHLDNALKCGFPVDKENIQSLDRIINSLDE